VKKREAAGCSQVTGAVERTELEGLFGGALLEFAECGWKNAGQGVGARAGEEKAKGKQELRESVLHTTLRYVVAVGKMNEEDGACHHDHDAEGADPNEDAREQGESTRELRQTHEEGGGRREVHESREALNAGTAKGAKENGAAVIEKDECAGQTEDKKGEVELRGNFQRRR
jgi:hypothetical protein